jgi:pimeloyl-ACP methyl ester carboxylesterase
VSTKLFLNDEANQPLVVGLGGAEGGHGWAGPQGRKQRKLLEENGYAFLSIAYFGTKGTPENLDRIAIEGVHKAVIEASQDSRINENCIAVMGVSRGGELALLLGSYYEEYKSVIGIVPGSSVFAAVTDAMSTPGFSYNGNPLAFVPVPWSATPDLLSGNLRGAFEKMMKNTAAMENSAIRVENISGPVLLISGAEDEQWPSMEMSATIMSRLKENDFPYPSLHITLKGGHNEHHDNFDKVVTFLNEQFLAQPGCSR